MSRLSAADARPADEASVLLREYLLDLAEAFALGVFLLGVAAVAIAAGGLS
jgi:hypothetical protein